LRTARASEMHVTQSMHERKALMERLSDAFIALPGGFGTLDELCEILTWRQLGLHAKPIGLLDVDDFFAPLAASFDHAVAKVSCGRSIGPSWRGRVTRCGCSTSWRGA
jgi:uncharacterized protein (TIGR00730 family)